MPSLGTAQQRFRQARRRTGHALIIQEASWTRLKEPLARLISQHRPAASCCSGWPRTGRDSFADILGPEVFRAMLTAMERDQFNERRSNRLRDFILDDQTCWSSSSAPPTWRSSRT